MHGKNDAYFLNEEIESRPRSVQEKWLTILALVLSSLIAHSSFGQEAKSPEALALLRGVLSARNTIDTLHVELLLQFRVPGKETTFHWTVDQQGHDRRVEHLIDSAEPASYLINGDIVNGYRRKVHEDLQIYELQRSSSIRGDVAFDPRISGMSDMPSVDGSLTKSLWIDECETAKVLESGLIDGVTCRRVEATRENVVSEFWIDDSTFRLYRRLFTYPGGTLQIDSSYQGAEAGRVLPVSVNAKRVEGGEVVREMSLTVKSLEVNVPIPPDRFTIASFNLPINTMRNDYRISRITGYWNGIDFSESPVPADHLPLATPATPVAAAQVPRSRVWLIALNAVALFGLAGLAWWRRRGRST